MSGIAPGPDPSMEDILASIRRILDEDPGAPATGAPAPHHAPVRAPAPDDDDFVLDDSMLEPGSAAAEPPLFSGPIHQPTELAPPGSVGTTPGAVTAAEPVSLAPTSSDTESAPMSADSDDYASPAAEPQDAPAALLGAQASQVTASSMMSLVRAVTADRASMVRAAGPSIEDVVREELRPLLKDWLETHLPPLVERLVRTEIERVVGRATF